MQEPSNLPKELSVESLPKELERKLMESDPNLFKGVAPQQRQKIINGLTRVSMTIMSEKTHKGPLPDPETLSGYNDLIPNGADRIMTVFEKQATHRMDLEQHVVKGQMFQSMLGQIFAFVIGIFALGCATYTILNGYQWAGAILGVGGLTGLVTAFIKGKASQERNLEDKKPEKSKR